MRGFVAKLCIFCFLCVTHTCCSVRSSELSSNNPNRTSNDHSGSEIIKASNKEIPITFDDKVFIKKMFEKFGDGNSMSFEGFELLLKTIGLEHLVVENEEIEGREESDSKMVQRTNTSPDTMLTSAKLNVSTVNARVSSNSTQIPRRSTSAHVKCFSSRQLFTAFSGPIRRTNSAHGGTNPALSQLSLSRLCPGLLYQLTIMERDHTESCLITSGEEEIRHVHAVATVNQTHVWLYATLSIVLISLCGLLGVAVIPIMQKKYYRQLLQFLVALAVGSLCGDALLHLLPHAMLAGSGSLEDSHDTNMWRGLVASLGIVFFFCTEKCLTLLGEWRKKAQRRKKGPARVRVMRDGDTMGDTTVGEKLCKHKYSSYPYCYDEITTDIADEHAKHHSHGCNTKPLDGTGEQPSVLNMQEGPDSTEAEPSCPHNPVSGEGPNVEPNASEAESYTVIIREHENQHHGHSHTHGHVHSPPKSLSSVAWMVVMGDGLHNFTDGMAVGAAFASDIPGGFSTAVAVFCHELPHELGDFAVLLKAGMSPRQAVCYNLLSSVLCLFGMVVGVFLGHNETCTAWVFSLAAGMFLYIALVDMIPELTTSHSKEGGSLCQCLLQFLGLMTGIGVMLLIAAYEHDLTHVFSSHGHDGHKHQ